MLVDKTTYKKIVKNLEHYKKQNDDDQKENPNAIRIDWKPPLLQMVENTLRKNHQPCPKGIAEEILEYLTDKGLLINYLGGYTFPGTITQTREEIINKTKEVLRRINK